MNALFLEDIRKFNLRESPKPEPKENEVLVRVGSVGICGTDLHIFSGWANYYRDERGQPIPLRQKPQILGHEICGKVERVGVRVRKCQPGDSVVVDPVLTCWSLGREPKCEYCETGDSHQCEVNQIYGVTAPGAFQDYVKVPETNIAVLPQDMPFGKAAMIEPFGCVLHASERMEHAANRYTFEGRYRIRYALILGAGPAGLLFLQYLRNVRKFDGEIFVAEMKESKLNLVKQLGGTPLDVKKLDLISEIHKRTHGERVHYLVEATGSGSVLDWIPAVVRRQATVLLYGAGHSGKDIGCLTPFQVMEITLVTSAGASCGLDATGTPVLYKRSSKYIRDGKIEVESLVTHRYRELGELQEAFSSDAEREDFVKGVYVRSEFS